MLNGQMNLLQSEQVMGEQMLEITVTKFHYLTSANRQHLKLMTTYNNYHCQAHWLADTLKISLMYNHVLWNNFLKKIYKKGDKQFFVS